MMTYRVQLILAVFLLGAAGVAADGHLKKTVDPSRVDLARGRAKLVIAAANNNTLANEYLVNNIITQGELAAQINSDNANAITVLALDNFWTLVASFMVFLMQAGFALLEAGSVREKNTHNILFKNVVDPAVAGLAFWFCGYAFAFGDGNDFIGATDFFLATKGGGSEGWPLDGYTSWIFQWAFAATASTIVSGAVAERCDRKAYVFYTFFITGFIYPVVVHWVWGGGVLGNAENLKVTMIDFAGSGVVHMTGGAAALTGAIVLGPRIGRFKDKTSCCKGEHVNEEDFQPSSMVHCALGTLILWFGWFGFNAGSTTAIHGSHALVSLAAINTVLAPAASCVTCVVVFLVTGCIKKGNDHLPMGPILNCVLAGLVGITAGCTSVRPWCGVLIGMISCPVYLAGSALLKKLRIDDVIDASPVHLGCGIWGCLAVGIFGDKGLGADTDGGELFAIQLAGVALIFVWVVATSFLLFYPMMKIGFLRVPRADEEAGLDISHHGRGNAGSGDSGGKPVTANAVTVPV